MIDKLNKLFDDSTFAETNKYSSQNGDGVVTGYGAVYGRPVFAAIQDESYVGGSLSAVNCAKIVKTIDFAVKAGAPFVLVINSAGARTPEGLQVLDSMGSLVNALSGALGLIPTNAVVNGKCLGTMAIAANLCDFIFYSEDKAQLSVAGLDICKDKAGKSINCNNGSVACFCENEDACFEAVKKLLEYLPDNSVSCDNTQECEDDLNRVAPNLNLLNAHDEYDVKSVIEAIADNGEYFEIYADYAKNIVTAFARFGGIVAAVIANQPAESDGALTQDAANKASKVIDFCDKYSVPVITLTNTGSYVSSEEQEKAGVAQAAALLISSFANTDVPKINIITGKAYGNAYISMNSKQIGCDIAYGWTCADIALISPEANVLLMKKDEIKAAEDPVAKRKELIDEYRKQYQTPMHAASCGMIDDVITPDSTRARIISALEILSQKLV